MLSTEKALEFLFSRLPMFSRVGAAAYKPGLDTSRRLDAHFNHPHTQFKSIHVAGTNGKGSVSNMLASVLAEQGYKTGLYTSPHLVDFSERIRVNGKRIDEKAIVEFVNNWQNSDYEGKPSFFELTMMMAFNHFANEKVDFAVIEVGMGGRLDSTNIITPVLSLITNISKDHTQFLGDTLPKIATEKAGIIKRGVPVVIGEAGDNDVRNVFIKKASEEDSELVFAELNGKYQLRQTGEGWDVKGNGIDTIVKYGGDYQYKNILTVLTAIEKLREQGIEISDKAINSGLSKVKENTEFVGRWSVSRSKDKDILCIEDTGHNIAGMTSNIRQLKRLQSQRGNDSHLHIIIGFVADKDVDEILTLMPKDATYYVTNAHIPRAMPANELKKKFDQLGLNNEVFPSPASAQKMAFQKAKPSDIIFTGGSTFIVADLYEQLANEL